MGSVLLKIVMGLRRVVQAIAAGTLALTSALPPATAQQRPVVEISFGLFGDLAYVPAREPQMQAVLDEMSRTPLAFVVHVGDLGSPRTGSCTDALWQRRLAQFRASANPLIYTPGDNEWTDCHDAQGVPGADPLERLDSLRRAFFAGDQSLGQRTLPLVRQSAGDARFAQYRENVRWQLAGVTFLTIHVVGSNNGRGRTQLGDAEYAERTAANIAWLAAGFAEAKAQGSRAVMILQQANMFPGLTPFPDEGNGKESGFDELRSALATQAAAFVRPVVLVHGDTHYFRVDKPFMVRRGSDPVVPNLTRLETFGDPFHHWVQVDVETGNPSVFTFRERIVPANADKGR